jgi:hypothetical protein
VASEKTEKLNLTVYPDIEGVYQRDLRKSYYDNFLKIDKGVEELENNLKGYVDEVLEGIENGYY